MQIATLRDNPVLSLYIAITRSFPRLLADGTTLFLGSIRSLAAGLIRRDTSALTIGEKRKIALAALEARGGKKYRVLQDVEHTMLEVFAAASTARTVLDPLVDGLHRAGIRTKRTVGDVMRELDITQEELHVLCWCHRNDYNMEAREAANILSGTFSNGGKSSIALVAAS